MSYILRKTWAELTEIKNQRRKVEIKESTRKVISFLSPRSPGPIIREYITKQDLFGASKCLRDYAKEELGIEIV
jgi:hypothetical protein